MPKDISSFRFRIRFSPYRVSSSSPRRSFFRLRRELFRAHRRLLILSPPFSDLLRRNISFRCFSLPRPDCRARSARSYRKSPLPRFDMPKKHSLRLLPRSFALRYTLRLPKRCRRLAKSRTAHDYRNRFHIRKHIPLFARRFPQSSVRRDTRIPRVEIPTRKRCLSRREEPRPER